MLSNRNNMMSTENTLEEAVARLRAGKLVAIPTETVYGLAADATNDLAVSAIFEMKRRPAFNPLITHVSDTAMAQRYARWNERAEALAAAFWPGPLTLVLPRREDCPLSLLVSAGGGTVALRAPDHSVTRQLLGLFDGGIAAPSANRSGRVSPTQPQHVVSEFPDEDLQVLEGGATRIGIESTVIDCCGAVPSILRPGSITDAMIRAAGIAVESYRGGADVRAPRSPGMLLSHYAPSIPLRMNVSRVGPGEALLAFGPQPLAGAVHMVNLSEQGDLAEAAANLFSAIRSLDDPAYSGIAVMRIPETGIGAAINDRLYRASVK